MKSLCGKFLGALSGSRDDVNVFTGIMPKLHNSLA
jgi:hypothetical protein